MGREYWGPHTCFGSQLGAERHCQSSGGGGEGEGGGEGGGGEGEGVRGGGGGDKRIRLSICEHREGMYISTIHLHMRYVQTTDI